MTARGEIDAIQLRSDEKKQPQAVVFNKGTWIYPKKFHLGGILQSNLIAVKHKTKINGLSAFEACAPFTLWHPTLGDKLLPMGTYFGAYAKKAR